LAEIGAVRATNDVSEVGDITPNVRAEAAVNPDSELLPVTRANGVLLALSVPGGGLISGTSGLMMMDGWTWEDMTLKGPVAMHVCGLLSGAADFVPRPIHGSRKNSDVIGMKTSVKSVPLFVKHAPI
jgi:hypothetical protein